MAHERDRELMPEDDDGGLASFSAALARGDFLGRAGGLAAGLTALGGLAFPFAAGAKTLARDQKIAVIEQVFADFFTANFQKPLSAYLKKSQPGWEATFGNENNTVPTGINLLNQYTAANYGIIILSTGDSMATWQRSVQQAVKKGVIFINHSTQAVSGATQNVLFSHKQAGVDIGNAAAAWAKKNGIDKPVVGLIGNLSDAQGSKRTDWAWKTIKAKIPAATLAGKVQGIDTASGGKAASNLLSSHPDINILITFNTLAGTAAMTAAQHANKKDPNAFYLGTTDFEEATLKTIAKGGTIYQSNWGAFFPASMVLMAKDGINKMAGKPIKPTRLLFGATITSPAEAQTFLKSVFDPLNPKYASVYTKYFKYLNTPTATAQVPPGQ